MADDSKRKLKHSVCLIISILFLLAVDANGDKILEQFMSARDDDMLLCVKVKELSHSCFWLHVLVCPEEFWMMLNLLIIFLLSSMEKFPKLSANARKVPDYLFMKFAMLSLFISFFFKIHRRILECF